MQKTYVLDTNILIQAPYALESFEDNHIVLPLAVLEALDELQQAEGDQGGNARQVIRYLEQMRLRGNLVEGVALPGGGTLRLEVNHVNVTLPHGMNPDSSSSRVLKVCKGLMDDGVPAILVTRDIVIRIQAQMMGVPAEDFTTDQVSGSTGLYTGRAEMYVPDELLSTFKKKGVAAESLYTVDQEGQKHHAMLTENQFILLRSDTEEKKTMLGRFQGGMVSPFATTAGNPSASSPTACVQRYHAEHLLPCH